MNDKTYLPFGAVDPLHETKEEWLARRIKALETQIRMLERDVKDRSAALNRSRDMIEQLMVALQKIENLPPEAKILLGDAGVYLNMMTYAQKEPIKPYKTVTEHMKELKEVYMKPMREDMKATAYAVKKKEELKKSAAKKGKANDGNKGKTKRRR